MKYLVFPEGIKVPTYPLSKIYIKGIVYISDNYIELGWFTESPKNISVYYRYEGEESVLTAVSKEACGDHIIWSNQLGRYVISTFLKDREIKEHTLIRGQGSFPYTFPRKYEAEDNLALFKGAQEVLSNKRYPLSKYLNYTFGLEFETSMGYIPQDICFRDGLIPLRDGSISGIEYSTVVLKGNRGLNLLKQQLDTLKKYTKFNKECALHIHLGGYPVDPLSIFILYKVWFYIEQYLETESLVPRQTFYTNEYKNNGKSYCQHLPYCSNFNKLYKFVTTENFLGNLYQPHPADKEKRAKWNIQSRYYGLNLVNMLCYKKPKTVEFRFLRPTFNFRKITLWLYVLNAVLKYSELLYEKCKDNKESCLEFYNNFDNIEPKLTNIINQVYDENLANFIFSELELLKIEVISQTMNGDYCGRDIEFEEELFG